MKKYTTKILTPEAYKNMKNIKKKGKKRKGKKKKKR